MARPINRFEAYRATQCANAALSIMECEISSGATIDDARETARKTTFTSHLNKQEQEAFNAVVDTIGYADIDGQCFKEGRESLIASLEAQGYAFGPIRKAVFVHFGFLL